MYNLLFYRLKKPQKNIFCLKSINNEKGMQDFSFSEELTYDYGGIAPVSDQWFDKCQLVGIIKELDNDQLVCERYDDYVVSVENDIRWKNFPKRCLANDFDCLNTMNNIQKCEENEGHLDWGAQQHECHIGDIDETAILGVNSCLIDDKYACPYMFLTGDGRINFDE